jgi:MOSC domain-containing protein YiiM
MGKVRAVCISAEKGMPKYNIGEGELLAGQGLKGDAHAGAGERQVSLLSWQKIEEFQNKGADVAEGAFGENLIVEGIDLSSLSIGTRLSCGSAALEITQIGKECKHRCKIFDRMGDCIMPREGVFAKVIQGGSIKAGDDIYAE